MGTETFHCTQPRPQDNWRAAMLTERGKGFVNLEELAEQLSRHRYPGK
jgi:hypothetical protein